MNFGFMQSNLNPDSIFRQTLSKNGRIGTQRSRQQQFGVEPPKKVPSRHHSRRATREADRARPVLKHDLARQERLDRPCPWVDYSPSVQGHRRGLVSLHGLVRRQDRPRRLTLVHVYFKMYEILI